MMSKSSNDRLGQNMCHKGCTGKIGRSLKPWPSPSSHRPHQAEQEVLFDGQRKDNAADHFTWETCRYPPTAAEWGHWGKEDN